MKRVIISTTLVLILTPTVHAKNPAAVEIRVNATCIAMASGSGPASPEVIFDIYWHGARDACKGKPAICHN